MSLLAEIETMGAILPPGSSGKFVCPKCEGGRSHETSFSLTRNPDSSLVWICFRASCGYRGGVYSTSEGPQAPAKPKPAWEPATYQFEDASEMPAWLRKRFVSWFGSALHACAAARHFEVSGSNAMPNAVQFTLRDCFMDRRGWQARSETPDMFLQRQATGDGVTKRVRSSVTRNGPLYGYYAPDYRYKTGIVTDRTLAVIVEDPMSAIRLASVGIPAITLCGTHLNPDILLDAEKVGYTRFLLALDRDAAATSMDISRRVRQEYALDVYPVLLRKDFKDIETTKEVLNTLVYFIGETQ